MYILWVLGAMVQERTGNGLFLALYLGTGALVGAVTVGVASLLGQSVYLAGCTAPLLALLVCWGMYYPDSQLRLFFLIPLQTRWVLAGVAGTICLLSLSQLDFVSFVFYLSSMVVGYIFGGLILGLAGPFPHFQKVDHLLERGHDWLFGACRKGSSAKIMPFTTTSEEEDEAFVDAMLAKISERGEQSLTPKEQERMRDISRRKRKR